MYSLVLEDLSKVKQKKPDDVMRSHCYWIGCVTNSRCDYV